MNVRLPATMPVNRIEVRRIQMLPGHPAGLHVHNGLVVGSIVEGSVVYQIKGEPPCVLGPARWSANRRAHASPDSTPAITPFLAYFPLRSGQEPAIDVPNG